MDPAERKRLLKKHAPLLRFDSLESLRPMPINDYVERSIVATEREEEVEEEDPLPASLELLAEPGTRDARLNPVRSDDDLHSDLRSSLLLDKFGGARNSSDAGTCYGRVIEDGRWVFLQYWFFYVDNPYVLGPGRHDGDWEWVQMGLSPRAGKLEAIRLTFAQHGKGYTVRPPRGKDRPQIFVAVGSHAAYPAPGTQPHFPVPDECDAEQAPAEPPQVKLLSAEEPAEDWRYWWGHWGMDRGLGTWIALRLRIPLPRWLLTRLNGLGVGDSPVSPARQGVAWDHPARFQGYGRIGELRAQGRRAVHGLGKATWPRADPGVTVYRISQNAYSFTARASGHLLRRINRVTVTFEDASTGQALGRHTLPAGRSIGRLEHAGSGPVAWRAAGYNLLCQRGNVTEQTTATTPVEWPLGISGKSGAEQDARRVFEGELTEHLRAWGAGSKDALVGKDGLGWFWLRLSEEEVERVIDAARTDGMVAPLGQAKDAAGQPIDHDEWTQTDQGRGLERGRALSFRDSLVAARGVSAPATSAAEKWGKRAAALLVPFLPFLAAPIGVSTSVAVLVVGIVIALVLRAGIRGEDALRHAAHRWPRLQTCRPHIYAWQTTSWRPWERVPVALAALIYAVIAGVALKWPGGWSYNPWGALAGLGAVVILSSLFLCGPWRRWQRLARAYRKERDAVNEIRRDNPDHPCALGHRCAAAVAGSGASCPEFGPQRTTL